MMILLMKMEVRAAALMRKAPPSSLRSEPSPRLYVVAILLEAVQQQNGRPFPKVSSLSSST